MTMRRLTIAIAAACALLTGCGEQSTSNSGAISLKRGQMLLLESTAGVALVRFTSFGSQNGKSFYEWRYRSFGGVETEGTGSVFERYQRTWTSLAACKLQDIGSVLTVHAGGCVVKWSYGSLEILRFGGLAWLYPETNQFRTSVLADNDFKNFDLKKIAEQSFPGDVPKAAPEK
jgi:hypothetical protein